MISAIMFDVFGTLADWRGSIVNAFEQQAPKMDIDRVQFAEDWMREYGRRVARLTEYKRLDEIMFKACFSLLARHDTKLWTYNKMKKAACLARTWERLSAWPDVSRGIDRLIRERGIKIAAFSNANTDMLDALSRSLELPFHVLISAEEVKAYKPDPACYRHAINKLGFPPCEILLAASHCFDLNAGHKHGMKTALIYREDEPGSNPSGLDHEPEYVVNGVDELAEIVVTR